jgi:DNA-binding NarL/FixJ family response regulator
VRARDALPRKYAGRELTQARILFGDISQLMQEIVEQVVESEPGMLVVGHCANAELASAVQRADANVVIVEGTTATGPDLLIRLVTVRPSLKVIVIAEGGRKASLYDIRHLQLVDPSPTALIGAIRSVLVTTP